MTRFDSGISHGRIKRLVEEGQKPGQIAKALKIGRTGVKRLLARMRARGEL